jgi:hypothetical protein
MPVYVQRSESGLAITFTRDGAELDHRVAPDGMRAVSLAMRMLALQDELHPGDKLTVASVMGGGVDNPKA